MGVSPCGVCVHKRSCTLARSCRRTPAVLQRHAHARGPARAGVQGDLQTRTPARTRVLSPPGVTPPGEHPHTHTTPPPPHPPPPKPPRSPASSPPTWGRPGCRCPGAAGRSAGGWRWPGRRCRAASRRWTCRGEAGAERGGQRGPCGWVGVPPPGHPPSPVEEDDVGQVGVAGGEVLGRGGDAVQRGAGGDACGKSRVAQWPPGWPSGTGVPREGMARMKLKPRGFAPGWGGEGGRRSTPSPGSPTTRSARLTGCEDTAVL